MNSKKYYKMASTYIRWWRASGEPLFKAVGIVIKYYPDVPKRFILAAGRVL